MKKLLTTHVSILVKNEHLMRHCNICAQLYYSICKALGIETADKWYIHTPKPVCEQEHVNMLWNYAVHTDRSYGK